MVLEVYKVYPQPQSDNLFFSHVLFTCVSSMVSLFITFPVISHIIPAQVLITELAEVGKKMLPHIDTDSSSTFMDGFLYRLLILWCHLLYVGLCNLVHRESGKIERS